MNLLDIVILAILAFYLISGMYRGSITSFLGTIGFVAAWYGAGRWYPAVANMALSNQTLMAVLNQYLEPESFFATHAQAVTTVAEVISGGETAIQNAIASVSGNLSVISKAFEANVRSQMFQNLGISTLADYLDQTIWQAVFNVGAFILCFVALYIVAMLVVNLLDHVISFPLLRGIDWLVGGLLGLARGVVICALLLYLLPAVIQIVSPEFASELVGNSTLINLISRIDILNVSALMKTLIGG